MTATTSPRRRTGGVLDIENALFFDVDAVLNVGDVLVRRKGAGLPPLAHSAFTR
jgi:hypothetical protein